MAPSSRCLPLGLTCVSIIQCHLIPHVRHSRNGVYPMKLFYEKECCPNFEGFTFEHYSHLFSLNIKALYFVPTTKVSPGILSELLGTASLPSLNGCVSTLLSSKRTLIISHPHSCDYPVLPFSSLNRLLSYRLGVSALSFQPIHSVFTRFHF